MRWLAKVRLFFVASVGALLLACTTATPEMSIDGGRDGASDGRKDVLAPDTYAPACTEIKACTDPPPSMAAQCIVSFDAQVVDMMGAPIFGETLYFCGINICTPPVKSDAQGRVHIDICWWYVKGAVKYLGGVDYVSFAAQSPLQTMVTFPAMTLIPLPKMGIDIPMGGGAITSNNVTLTLAANSAVKFDPSQPNDADLHRFRAVEIPLSKAPPGTPPNVEVLWGIGPVNAALAPAAQLTMPNTQGWPANAAVEFYVNGADAFDPLPPYPYGGWGAIGIGHVSADGTTVSTDSGMGNGIPMLGIVGLHKP